METKSLQVEIQVPADMQKVWLYWNSPEHIKQWYFASPEWYVPAAQNDLVVGGKLCITMAAKDESMRFDFSGTYTHVQEPSALAYTLDDGRKVRVQFISQGAFTQIIETFEPENIHPEDFQKAGWFAILEQFKSHVTSK